MNLDVDYTNTLIGIQESAESMVALLKKMGLNSEVKDAKTLIVHVDAIRTDILHPCDLAEDVAIAYDFNKIENVQVETATIGQQQLINKFSDLLR